MPITKTLAVINDFSSIGISLASAETILSRSHGEVLTPKPLITVHLNQKWMAFSVKKSLDQLKTMSVIVGNTNAFDTKVLFVIVVV